MVRWAYHATNREFLPKIAQVGLIPQTQPHEHQDEERGVEGAVIFFSPTRELAAQWGNTVLRFPWPDDAEEDPYSDAFLERDGSINHTNWYTETEISPADLQVYDGMWRALSTSHLIERERLKTRSRVNVRRHVRRVRR